MEIDDQNIIDSLFYYISIDIIELKQYKMLYSDNEKQNKLMEHSADSFFKILKMFFWDRFTINICKLTDSKKTSGNENLSIDYFFDIAEKYDYEFKENIEKNISEIRNLAKPFKLRRNKLSGHRDLYYAIKQSQLPECSDAFERIEAIYKLLEENMSYFNNILKLDSFLMKSLEMDGDSKSLLNSLRKGLLYDGSK